MSESPASRRDELASRLRDVRRDVDEAAARAGRGGDEVRLIVVTKTWPVGDVRLLSSLGVTEVGENRHQECRTKVEALAGLPVRWHFIGQVQSNKAAAIAAYADSVHSVDSVRVARRLDAGARQHQREVECFVQVSLDPDEETRARRGGLTSDDLLGVAEAVEEAAGLRLRGVMGVPPRHGDAQAAYRQLRVLSERLQHRFSHAAAISAGMSGDFADAIVEGATHVRVGSAVLGQRPALR
ncbi:MAG: YggS family pyridoxal phosphate-dependent enzyme [Nocardioidaceae bacterium]